MKQTCVGRRLVKKIIVPKNLKALSGPYHDVNITANDKQAEPTRKQQKLTWNRRRLRSCGCCRRTSSFLLATFALCTSE